MRALREKVDNFAALGACASSARALDVFTGMLEVLASQQSRIEELEREVEALGVVAAKAAVTRRGA